VGAPHLAEIRMSSHVFSLEYVALFAIVYTLPGWFMAALTSGRRAKLAKVDGKKEDNSASQVVRLTNRTIASTAMYVVPFFLTLRNLDVWSPWSGGQWDSPMDETQRALLHMQLMYYVMDMPYTVLKGDTEQVIHHVIGFGLAVPTVFLGKCGLVMCAILFTEQARPSLHPSLRRRSLRCGASRQRRSRRSRAVGAQRA